MARTSEKKLRALTLRTSMIKPGSGDFTPGYDADKLQRLTDSVEHYGIVQPLIVTREPLELWYTLVAGRRRLAAAKSLGLESVPVLVVPAESANAIRLLDNLHREPQSCFEAATLLEIIQRQTGGDNEALGHSLGLGEDEIGETLQLLRLDADQIELCRASGVDQEMALKILAMPKSERDKLFFGLLNPARDLEERIGQLRERLGLGAAEAPRRTVAIKDVRIFFNTIERAFEIMKSAGIEASSERHDYDGFIEYLIRIPTQSADQAVEAATAPGA